MLEPVPGNVLVLAMGGRSILDEEDDAVGEGVVSPSEARGRRGFVLGARRSVLDAVAGSAMAPNKKAWFDGAAMVADIQPSGVCF